jgi:Domain of unknown function (DUF4387)
MTRLLELCSLIRSKNAGPFWLTFDVVARDLEAYRRIVASGVLNAGLFARLYGVTSEEILIVHHDHAEAVKVSFPRPVRQGDLADSDSYGGQFYAPLIDLEIPETVGAILR